MKPKRKRITVLTHTGPVRIMADVYGLLAVHRSLGRSWLPTGRFSPIEPATSMSFSITHVPTGLQLMYNVPSKKKVLQRLQTIQHLDWSTPTSAALAEKYQKISKTW